MIGYDLDGVLITDTNHKMFSSIEDYLSVRTYMPYPNFVPEGEYCIITGRPASDFVFTMRWVKSHLHKNPPKVVCNDRPDDMDVVEYKAQKIKELGVLVYLESDFEQVEKLTELCPGVWIVHFPTLINLQMKELYETIKIARTIWA